MSLQPLYDRLDLLADIDGWWDSPLARIAATRDDPLLFAYVYLRHHLRLPDLEGVSFSPIHVEWYEAAEQWMRPGADERDIYVAPRGTGKTSMWFLIIPMWAAAHKHIRFIAAFADNATMAESHLATFRSELDRNAKLRRDYPELCAPAKRTGGTNVSDNRTMIHTASGFVFAARGVDSTTLGLKVGERRPEILLLDDVEPAAANYSAYLVEKRLATITDAVLPMGAPGARTVMVGTTTLTGSIIHQAVLHEKAPARWITDEGFRVHHSLPFDERGESIWPERWSTEYLRRIEDTHSFALNFLNQPRALDGEYWRTDDYSYGDLPSVSRRIVMVDPAVTTARSSDETGLAVVGYSAAARKAVVYEAFGVRLKGEPLRARVLDLLARYPDVAEVCVERNQGGDLMAESVFHSMPVPLEAVYSTEKKEIRIERSLGYYRKGGVLHARALPVLEAQQQEFPRGLTDDVVDVVSLALDRLAGPRVTGKHVLHKTSV